MMGLLNGNLAGSLFKKGYPHTTHNACVGCGILSHR